MQRIGNARKTTIVAMLFLFMAINFADKAIFGLVAVPLMKDLAISHKEFGTIAGSFFFLFAISGIIVGFVSNRVSSKVLLCILVIIWSIAQIPIAAGAATIGLLMLSRIVLGIGEGPAYPLALHSCYKWFPDKARTVPTAFIMQGGQVGMLLAGPLVGYLTLSHGWRSVFWAMATAGLLWLVLWTLLGKEGPLTAQSLSQSNTNAKAASYRQLLLERTFLGNLLLYWIAYWATALVFTWLPAYLQQGLQYAPDEAGWLFSLSIFLAIPIVGIASFFSNRMLNKGHSSRSARAGIMFICTMLGSASLFTAYLLKGEGMVMVLLIALGLSLPQVGFVLCAAIAAEISPAPQRGSMLSITNSVATTAGLVAPMVIGRMIDGQQGQAGFLNGFLFTAIILGTGAIVGFWLVNPDKTMAARCRPSALLP